MFTEESVSLSRSANQLRLRLANSDIVIYFRGVAGVKILF